MYPFLVKKTKNWFCVIKIRNTILTITHWHIAGPVEARRKPGGSPAEAAQGWSGLVRQKQDREPKAQVHNGSPGTCFPGKF